MEEAEGVKSSSAAPASTIATSATLTKRRSSMTTRDGGMGRLRLVFVIVVLACVALMTVELRGFGKSSYLYQEALSLCEDSLQQPTTVARTYQQQQQIAYYNFNATNVTMPVMSSSTSLPLPKFTNASLVVMVLGRRDAFRTRQVIRETWANGHDNVYFVVGQGCTVPKHLRAKDEGENPICQVGPHPLPANYRKRAQKQYDAVAKDDARLLREQAEYGDLILSNDFVDVYRNLPKKLKAAYSFVHDYLPTVDWVVKVDDDFFVRIDDFENYLKEQKFGQPQASISSTLAWLSGSSTSSRQLLEPVVVGDIKRDKKAHNGGKWKEVPQYPKMGAYPPFPLGSVGHVVSRPIVDYIHKNKHLLFDYQGEDVSVGIWLQEFGPEAFLEGGDVMVNNGQCRNPKNLVIGHDLTLEKLRQCHLEEQRWRQRPKTQQSLQ